jgi:hypothetical protein
MADNIQLDDFITETELMARFSNRLINKSRHMALSLSLFWLVQPDPTCRIGAVDSPYMFLIECYRDRSQVGGITRIAGSPSIPDTHLLITS